MAKKNINVFIFIDLLTIYLSVQSSYIISKILYKIMYSISIFIKNLAVLLLVVKPTIQFDNVLLY